MSEAVDPTATAVDDDARPTRSAGRRRWLGLAVLALPTLVVSVDVSVLFLAVPTLSRELGASQVEQLWITDIYGFLLAGLLVTMGTLGDRIGRRRLLLIGGTLFGAASVVAAFSVSPAMLILARALMGVAAATIAPSTLALISNLFPEPKQRALAIGAWMACFVGGTAVGPIIGGLLLAHFWWGSVFLLAPPVTVLLLVAGPLLLPEYRNPDNPGLDLTSVALSLLAILPFVYGLKEIARAGAAPLPIAAVAVGVVVGLLFVRRQQNSARPLVDLRLFHSTPFTVTLIMLLVMAMLMGGTALLVSLWLQLVDGLSPLVAALWLVPQTVTMVVGSLVAPILVRRTRAGVLITLGLVVTGIGLGSIAFASAAGLPAVVIGLAVAGGGIGVTVTLATDLVVGSAPPAKAGSAASMSETSNELGIALGIAVLGSISAVVYRAHLAADGLGSAESRRAAVSGIAGAARAASDLGGDAGRQLLSTAGAAFTSGLVVVAVVGAVVTAAVVVLCASTIARKPQP